MIDPGFTNVSVNGDGTVNVNGADYSSPNDVYNDYPELIDSPTIEFTFDGKVNGGSE